MSDSIDFLYGNFIFEYIILIHYERIVNLMEINLVKIYPFECTTLIPQQTSENINQVEVLNSFESRKVAQLNILVSDSSAISQEDLDIVVKNAL